MIFFLSKQLLITAQNAIDPLIYLKLKLNASQADHILDDLFKGDMEKLCDNLVIPKNKRRLKIRIPAS